MAETMTRPRPDHRTYTTAPGSGELVPGGPGTELAHPDPGEIAVRPPETLPSEETIRIVLTSLDKNVDNFAREAAHEKFNKKKEGGFFKRMAVSAWHYATRQHQLVKATKEARAQILESGNLRHHHGVSDESWRVDTVRRFGSDYGEHLIHEDAGETFNKLGAEAAERDPNARRMREDILEVLRQDALGNITDEASRQAMLDRMFQEWRQEGIGQEYIGEGQLLAHNMADMGAQVKAILDSAEGLSAVEREAKLEAILANAEIVTGEAKVGSRVEIEATQAEKLAEKLKNVPFLNEGRLAKIISAVGNETVLGVLLSVGSIASKQAIGRLGAILVPGLGASIVAGIRERRALKDERALMERRRAAGLEVDEGSKAQVEMDASLHEKRPVNDLLDELSGLYNDEGELDILNREDLERALEIQAELGARFEISDREGKQLIDYSATGGEQFDLDLAKAKLDHDMRKLYANPVAQAMLDIKPEETFDKMYEDQKSIAIGMLRGEITEKDQIFRNIVIKRGLQKALMAGFFGAAIGYGVEAAKEAFNHFFEQWGMDASTAAYELASYEATADGPTHAGTEGVTTIIGPNHAGSRGPTHAGKLEGPQRAGNDNAGPTHAGTQQGPHHAGTSDSGPTHAGTEVDGPSHAGSEAQNGPDHAGTEKLGETKALSDTSKLTLPEGYSAERVGDKLHLTTPDGKTFNLEINKDGSLSQNSLNELNKSGYNVLDKQEMAPGKPEVTKQEVSAADFVNTHKGEMTQIGNREWMVNADPNKSDLNELGAQNHLDAKGNIVVSIKGMTAGGSFRGSSGINWHEAAQGGHLKVFLSASPGSQAHAFEVTINPDGTAIIDKNSPAGALFDQNGKFIGGYQEIALKGDVQADGSYNIAPLATVVGSKSPTFIETIEKPTVTTTHDYTVTKVATMASTSPIDEPIAPIIPIMGRRKLGEAERPEPAAAIPEAPVAPVVDLAAERAARRGLPPASSEVKAIGGAETPPTTGKPGAETRTDQSETYTPEERAFIDQIDKENRTFPPEFRGVDLSKYSKRAQKAAVAILHSVLENNPQGAKENDFGWRRRIVRTLRIGATSGLRGNQALPAGVEPILKEAFTLLLEIQPPGSRRPAGGGRQRAA